MKAKAIGAFGVLVGLAGMVGACNGLLGISDAKIDPTLEDASASTSGGDAGSPSTVDPNGCEAYCDAIMNNCKGDNAEYTTMPVCLAMCSHFEDGVPGASSGDSRACRIWHAGAAQGDPGLHCRHAGPLGGTICGPDPCVPFCTLDFALCGLVPQQYPFDGGEHGCEVACAAFQYLTTGGTGDLTQSGGPDSGQNTLNCRLYHLESAYDSPGAAATHCLHTGTVSTQCN